MNILARILAALTLWYGKDWELGAPLTDEQKKNLRDVVSGKKADSDMESK